jgi:uncharacterized protein YdaU (DUF1376 family)
MNPKLLAEWFWTDRWMGSSAFLLPVEPRGLYREMLTQAWRRGAQLPNDHEAIRRAVGVTVKEWERCWPKVSRYWRVEGDALVNDTQTEIYKQALAVQERASERGRRGAMGRLEKLKLNSSSTRDQFEIKPPSPSPVRISRQAGQPANPLMVGRRPEIESEGYRLIREINALEPELDPLEILMEAAGWESKGGKLKTACRLETMTDDHLARTVHDLRENLAEAKASGNKAKAEGGK